VSVDTTGRIVVVTPVFEDRVASSWLFQELGATLGERLFVVAVDDGSVREPVEFAALTAARVQGVVIRLRRNVGHQRAIATGLAFVADQMPEARRVVVMDSDGEDLPSSISTLLAGLDDPTVDVVVAQRKSRVESLRFKALYVLYKWLFRLLTGRKIGFGNFMAMNYNGLRRLASMGELGTHVAGTVLLSRLRWKPCPLDRGPRYAGHSMMSFVGLVLHGFRGLMIFAEDVLVRVGGVCVLVASLSLLGTSAAIVLKSIGYATPGWFSVTLGILLLVFLQTGAIALMTLMLTGVVRSTVMLPPDYRLLIDQELRTSRPQG